MSTGFRLVRPLAWAAVVLAASFEVPAAAPGATPADRRLLPAAASSSTHRIVSFVFTTAGARMQSTSHASDFVLGDVAAGGASGSSFRTGYGFWGSAHDTAFTLSAPPPGPDPGLPPEPFEGIRVLRQPGRIGLQFSLHAAGPCALTVFDVTGRVVHRRDEVLPQGVATLWWSGEDITGRRAAGGLYFARVRWGGHAATARALWLR